MKSKACEGPSKAAVSAREMTQGIVSVVKQPRGPVPKISAETSCLQLGLFCEGSVINEIKRVVESGTRSDRAEAHLALSLLVSGKMSSDAVLMYFVRTRVVNMLKDEEVFDHSLLRMMIDRDGVIDDIVRRFRELECPRPKVVKSFDYCTGETTETSSKVNRTAEQKRYDKKNIEEQVAFVMRDLGYRHADLFQADADKTVDKLREHLAGDLMAWTEIASETDRHDMQTVHQICTALLRTMQEGRLTLHLSHLDFDATGRIEKFFGRVLDDFDMDGVTVSAKTLAEISAYRKRVQVQRKSEPSKRKWEITLCTARTCKFIEAIFAYARCSMFKVQAMSVHGVAEQAEISARLAEVLIQNVPSVDPTAAPVFYRDDSEQRRENMAHIEDIARDVREAEIVEVADVEEVPPADLVQMPDALHREQTTVNNPATFSGL